MASMCDPIEVEEDKSGTTVDSVLYETPYQTAEYHLYLIKTYTADNKVLWVYTRTKYLLNLPAIKLYSG